MSWSRLGKAKNADGLAFKSLHHFNLWHLISNLNSLAAQVLKARYFSQSSFLEAPLGSNPSFTWRSLWMSQEVIRQGSHWRVGSGDAINIWHDHWLGDALNLCVTTEPIAGAAVNHVGIYVTQ